MPRPCSALPISTEIASGRAYAQRVEAADGQSRFDAVTGAGQTDDGAGVAYQIEYAFRRADGGKVWIEDSGRWFAGADGKPARAHGVVRVIDERHERERKLIQLAQFDPLDRRDESRAPDRGARRHPRRSRALPRLLRLSARRHRSSRPAQRGLRLRRHRAGDRPARQAPASANCAATTGSAAFPATSSASS